MLSTTATTSPAATTSPVGDRNRDDDGRRAAAHDPAVVASETVRDAIDVDEQLGTLRRDDGPVHPIGDLETALVPAEAT